MADQLDARLAEALYVRHYRAQPNLRCKQPHIMLQLNYLVAEQCWDPLGQPLETFLVALSAWALGYSLI